MSARQTFCIIVLTAIYLCFELAFNARLLDVVGGAGGSGHIESIEFFGRSLSGCAAGLFVLQWLLSRRAASGSPGVLAIALSVLLTGFATYTVLDMVARGLVACSSPEFRRASQNIVLIQQALVDGRVELDGLNDDPELFARPAGKAFLALFPAMATSVERLDEKISSAKLVLISNRIEQAAGGPAGFYRDAYLPAVEQARKRWQHYSSLPAGDAAEARTESVADTSWARYLDNLGRRGWTPSTIPPQARAAVVRQVRASGIPVAADWSPDDEAGFRAAAAASVRKKLRAAAPSRIPPGLGWPAFFGHPVVQAELRKSLHLPASVGLQPGYGSAAEFQREVFAPMLRASARDTLAEYDAPARDFADGQRLAHTGRDMARLAIVPPLALLCSLIGAIGHLGKLCYLLLKGIAALRPREKPARLWPVILIIAGGIWIGLSLSDNAITRSRLYGYLHDQLIEGAPQGGWPRARARLLANLAHVVAVGQGAGYPYFESIRTGLLGGITYGYSSGSR